MTPEREYAKVTRELRAAMIRRDTAEIARLSKRQDELELALQARAPKL